MAEDPAAKAVLSQGGGNVNLQGCTVNVIANSQGNVAPQSAPTTKAESQFLASGDNTNFPEPSGFYGSLWAGYHTRQFKRCVNQLSYRGTAVTVTKDYRNEGLHEPGFDVYPRLRKVTRFYKGEMTPVVQYAKEEGFSVTTSPTSGDLISPEELVQIITDGEHRLIALLGQAGSGKTTLIKRIAQSVMEANELAGTTSIGGIFATLFRRFRIELVYLVNIRDIPNHQRLSTMELLFNKVTGLGSNDLHYGCEWLLQNQSNVVLFFDGLDQAPWSLIGEHRKIGPWDKASTSTIMHNILSGQLFPDARIVISSREHSIATLPQELRPESIVSLAGLSLEDIKKLFIAVMGEEGRNDWENMSRTSPALVRFSSVPLFLLFNAIVRKCNPQNQPDTMTGVMMQILEIMQRSDNITERDRIANIVKKMKPMAFKGTKEKRVIFTNKDLTDHWLDSKEVRDLIVKVPKSNILSQHLLEGDFLLFYSHQTIQEILSALHIADMDLPQFEEFVNQHLHDDHWSVVRRFLCGILLNLNVENKSIKDEVQRGEKQKLLRDHLTQRLKEGKHTSQILEIFGALYESNDAEFIKSHVHNISFKNEPITPDGMHALSSVMRRCGHLPLVRLVNCGLNEELLSILESNTRGAKLQVDVLDLKLIENMTFDLFLAIAMIATRGRVNEVKMDPCKYLKANAEQILELSQWDSHGKIYVLDVTSVTNMTFDLFLAIAKTATRCQVEKVHMIPWRYFKASEGHILELSQWDVCGKIKKIGISYVELDERDERNRIFAWTLGLVVRKCKVEKLTMCDCTMTDRGFRAFAFSVEGTKMKHIDLSNSRLRCRYHNQRLMLSYLVRQCGLQNLTVRGCNLDDRWNEAIDHIDKNTSCVVVR